MSGRTAPSEPRSSADRPIQRLLVANRGELVVRIARTCRDLGIACLALVPSDDARAWWARQADEIVPLRTTYLDADAVLEAARRARADAIHPGYGFLAEEPGFAQSVVAAGLRWLGPPAEAMRALGDKAAGRRLAASLGVPVLPGYDGDDQGDSTLRAEAERIGYPVLVKPSAGGGGKGMHAVARPHDFIEALGQARREATVAFGDARLVLERYLERPRHVEVQVLLDRDGNGVHLGERDCSLQRRHQKVIEESPSPAVDEALRARLGQAALRLCRAAGYVGAGTAEFLLDGAGAFFFLEVNARLQVEHPVTELVTGRDLVADQLRIAARERIGLKQDAVVADGHAIEARLYAEDPWDGFLPATGRIEAVEWPGGEGIRVDAGVGVGDVVGTRYDPLLAKILAHGTSRDEALTRLADAVSRTRVLGVTTNRGFLRWILDRAEMRSGHIRTDTIEAIWIGDGGDELTRRAFQAAAATVVRRAADPWGFATGFRLNAPRRVRIRIGQDQESADAVGAESGMAVDPPGSWAVVDLDGRAYRAAVAPAPTVDAAVSHALRERGAVAAVVASMPGTVLEVRVTDGQVVEAGETLVVLEAMKMENAVTAPAAATVSRVLVSRGDQVQRGDPLVELD